MSSDARQIARQVLERGYAFVEGRYTADDLAVFSSSLDDLRARFGSLPVYSPEPRWVADHVEVARPGLAIYQLLRFAPELALACFARAVDALRAVLGDDMHVELVGAVMSDETRPFTEWESHLGGIDDERWRIAGKRPRQTELRRVAHFLFLEDLDGATGPWRVLARAVGDPVGPPSPIGELDWPEYDTLTCRAGTVLLLEESVWHAVVPRSRPGTRRFVGAYFASSRAEPTLGRVGSLDELDREAAGPLLSSMLARRPS